MVIIDKNCLLKGRINLVFFEGEIPILRENRFLKWLLIIQSFTPLFLLLIIKYWDWNICKLVSEFFNFIVSGNVKEAIFKSFKNEELLRLMFIFICAILLVAGILIYLYFNKVQTVGFTDRAEKISVSNDTTETSAAFFVSYVMPMLLEDIIELKGFLCFVIIMMLLIMLMRNTNLYYQNPILAVLGYKTFGFKFSETSDSVLEGKEYIAITRGNIDETKIIKRKYIADNVFLIYNKN